ncbi:hypothetical protein TEA_025167 [Camellia sinensis var. sinensis]|uniref:Uncharacterized protein n=1 Tax=Camellia sinensis var. sinensis TaxID=542762 RepID=A0A4S4DAR1_CAMSN|nr:hypothetical protein TEA_025167 [Camellia sinensis var. sinensis]
MESMEAVRFRVVFEDGHILSKSQRSEGLNRSWLLLKPPLDTISDLCSYLAHVFNLYDSCPNGIILSMDGFVLPPFESTCIIKDKDVIRVKMKGGMLYEIVEVGDGANIIEEGEIVEKQPALTSVPLLANEEFENETGGYQSEPEEDEDNQSEDTLHVENSSDRKVVSKKRKASKKLQSSKKKQKRSTDSQDTENDFHIEQERCEFHPGKSIDKKKKVSLKGWKGRGLWCPLQSRIGAKQSLVNMLVKCKTKKTSTPRSAERNNGSVEPLPSTKRSDQLQENGTICIDDVHQMPDEIGKVPSRSARRKKAKRQWLRELAKTEKKELVIPNMQLHQVQSPEKDVHKDFMEHQQQNQIPNIQPHQVQSPEKDVHNDSMEQQQQNQVPNVQLHQVLSPEKGMHNNSIEHQQQNQNSEADNEIVPIVIRPGHIRFEPLGKGEEIWVILFDLAQLAYQAAQQNQVSVETFQWNGIISKKKGQKWGKEKFSSRRNDYKDSNEERSEVMTTERVDPPNNPLDFDKLAPLARLPKEGDVIAYRLLELSSTWTPELSSFRVGKTSRYDPESDRVLLTPVPEYPIIFDKSDEDECAQPPDDSLYGEDGSLEIEFSSLVDTRIVKHGNSDPAKAVTDCVNDDPVSSEVRVSTVVPSNNNTQTLAPTPEKDINVWDEFSEALNTKKEQLIREKGCSESSGKSSWSFRAMRGSALGPTMAILRAKNAI